MAAYGVPVTVTCRVLQLAGHPYHRRPGRPVTDAALEGLRGQRRAKPSATMRCRKTSTDLYQRLAPPSAGTDITPRTAFAT